MQPKWRDFDTAHIFLGSGFQPRDVELEVDPRGGATPPNREPKA